MKKILAVLAVLVMCFALGACGDDSETYDNALKLAEEGCYMEAIDMFESIGGYEDSSERAEALRTEYQEIITEHTMELMDFDTCEQGTRYFDVNRLKFPALTTEEIEATLPGVWGEVTSESVRYDVVYNEDGTGTSTLDGTTETLSWVVKDNNLYSFEGGTLEVDEAGDVWYTNTYGNTSKCDYVNEVRKVYDGVYAIYCSAGDFGVIFSSLMVEGE